MLALTPSLHKILDDRLVGQLKEKKIFTVRDFLRTDSCDLNHLFVGKNYQISLPSTFTFAVLSILRWSLS